MTYSGLAHSNIPVKAYSAGNIPCLSPVWSGEHSPEWVEGDRVMEFSRKKCLLRNYIGPPRD